MESVRVEFDLEPGYLEESGMEPLREWEDLVEERPRAAGVGKSTETSSVIPTRLSSAMDLNVTHSLQCCRMKSQSC